MGQYKSGNPYFRFGQRVGYFCLDKTFQDEFGIYRVDYWKVTRGNEPDNGYDIYLLSDGPDKYLGHGESVIFSNGKSHYITVSYITRDGILEHDDEAKSIRFLIDASEKDLKEHFDSLQGL